MSFRVLLDACVLVPYDLCNVLLSLADEGLFVPLWSGPILAETERAMITKLGIPHEKARQRIEAMTGAFPEALVQDFDDLVKVMRCHKKDRHVLAAAVRGDAQLLVTANLKDFPEHAADPYDIEVVHPDSFLSDQLDLDPGATMSAMADIATAYRAPAMDTMELLRRLRRTVPNFAQYVGMRLTRNESVAMSDTAMLVQADPDEAFEAFAPSGDLDLSQPQSVGFAWFSAVTNLPEYRPAFDFLCLQPGDWPNPKEVGESLEGYGLASGIDPAIEAPARMVFMRFIGDPGTTVQVFSGGMVRGAMLVMTLVLHQSGWKVFSLGPDFIYAGDVFDDWSYKS